MLGFRSLFRTHDTPELLDVAAAKLFVWVEEKGYDAKAITEGSPVEIGDDVWGSIQHHTDEAGSQTMRARVVENRRRGAWTSELTVHNSPIGNRGWVWLDIHKPDDHGWTATPRLARSLVRAMPVRDGAHLLNPDPRLVQEPDVEQVIAALTDPHRRGLSFVAGTAHNVKVSPWRDVVEELLDDTMGLANAWVLTAEATERFNFLVQRSHEVLAGRVRTYVPGVVLGKAPLGNPLDAERHRYLTRRSIEREPSRALRRVFGERARRQMISTPLPDLLRDLDRILRRDLDTALLDQLSPAHLPPGPGHRPAPVQPAPTQRPAPIQSEPVEKPIQSEPVEKQTPFPVAVRKSAGATTSPSGLETYLAALLRDLIGTDELTLREPRAARNHGEGIATCGGRERSDQCSSGAVAGQRGRSAVRARSGA